jgi:hypothetical protein
MSRSLAMLGLLVGLTACAAAAPPAPPPARPAPAPPPAAAPPLDRDLPRLVERSLAMYRAVAAALTQSASDCPAATERLRQLAATYRDVALANAKVLHDGRDAELRAALAPHDDDMSRAAEAVMHAPTMSACVSDAAFTGALDALFAPPP